MKLPRGIEQQRRPTPPNAAWMSKADLAKRRYQPGSILLGRDDDGEMIGLKDDRHMITVAGSRAGKSSTCLKPNLALWPSSVMCIDPKGELAMETAELRAAMGQNVMILDPFNEVKGSAAKYRVSYDPMQEILSGNPDDIIDNAALIADALIVSPKTSGDDHWLQSARNLIRGFILFAIYTHQEYGNPATLSDVRTWLTAPMGGEDEEDTDKAWMLTMFKIMSELTAFDGVLAGVGSTMKGKPENERGSIVSSAVEQTAFLDSRQMNDHLKESGLSTLRILKREPTTIYLVLPASRMATHFRWLRMVLTLAMATLENEPHQLGDDKPVLFILEEFPQLGYMRQIEAAAGLMAGYKVKLWTVLQDLSQLKSQYKESWETFIGNAGAVQAFGNTDTTTLEYISRTLGNLQIDEAIRTGNTASNITQGGMMEREQSKGVPLLAPFEIAQYCARETQRQIILFAGKPPAYISRMTHEEVENLGR